MILLTFRRQLTVRERSPGSQQVGSQDQPPVVSLWSYRQACSFSRTAIPTKKVQTCNSVSPTKAILKTATKSLGKTAWHSMPPSPTGASGTCRGSRTPRPAGRASSTRRGRNQSPKFVSSWSSRQACSFVGIDVSLRVISEMRSVREMTSDG